MAKIFESVLVSYIDKYVTPLKNQFGFVKNGGCNKAVFSFYSVKYFRNKNSNVYFCSLDATKAFDRINHFNLLSCLCDLGLPFDLIQVFHSWLRNMKSCVSWGNECSQFFNVLSGIQQGSLLGPKFFNLVMDKLLELLENNKLGCYVGGEFAGAFAYADDLIVLSSSVMQLQCILNLCCNFGKECDLTFNIDKSCCGCIGIPISVKQPVLVLDGKVLRWADSFYYLGVNFLVGSSLKVDCKPRILKFISSVCSVLHHKVKGFESIFADILIKKCLPVLTYGLECCMLDSVSLNSVNRAWNMAFKWLFNLRKYDSTRLLFLSCNTMSLSYLLNFRSLSFFLALHCYDNKLVHNLLISCVFNDKIVKNLFNEYYLCPYQFVYKDIVSNVRRKFENYCNEILN